MKTCHAMKTHPYSALKRSAWIPLILSLVLCAAARAENSQLSKWFNNLSGTTQLEDHTVDAYYQWREQWSNLAVVGDTVHTAWYSERWSGDPLHRLVYRRSANRGASWESPIILATGYPPGGAYKMINDRNAIQMCVVGQTVHVIAVRSYWPSGADWYYKLFYYRSVDGGKTFGAERTIYTGTNIWHIEQARVAASGQRVVVAFNTRANWYDNYHMMALVSNDNGGTFSTTEAASSVEKSGALEDLVVSGTGIHLLYRRIDQSYYYGSFQARIGVVSSTDGGTTYREKFVTTPVASGANAGKYYALSTKDYHNSPDLAVDGTTVHAIWTQLDTSYEGTKTLMYARSTDQGANFQTPVVIRRDSLLAAGQATIAAKGGHVYITYPTNDDNVWLRRSENGGASFYPQQNLSDNGGWWPAIAIDPADSSGATFHACWGYPTYRTSKDGGATLSRPLVAFPTFTQTTVMDRPQFVAGAGGLHMTALANYYQGDADVMYRVIGTQPQPTATQQALRLKTVRESFRDRADNFQAVSKSINFTGAMSADLWLREESVGMTTGYSDASCPVLAKPRTAANSYTQPAYAMGTVSGIGGRVLWAEITTTNGTVRIQAPVDTHPFAPQKWTHVAMTYKASGGADNFRLYQNGEMVASATVTGNIDPGTGNLIVGRYGDWTVDALGLWNRALTPTEVRNGMYGTRSGKESGLAAYYGFDGTLRDITGHGNEGIPMYWESYVAGHKPIKQAQKIQFTLNKTQRYKEGKKIKLNGKATSGLKVTYASSSPKVVRIKGRYAIIRSKGKTVITAKQGGNSRWKAAKPVKRPIVVK